MGRDGELNEFPVIVICASMSMPSAIAILARELHSQGNMVFFPIPTLAGTDEEMMERIRFQAIRAADMVYVITKFNGEVGESVAREMEYANSLGKAILVGHPAKNNWVPGTEWNGS